MAWTIVETPKAKYVLLFSWHNYKPLAVPSIEFDCLVLESGSGNPKQAPETIKSIQYRKLTEKAVKEKKPVWLTDVELTEKAYARSNRGTELRPYVANTLGGIGLATILKQIHSTNKKPTRRKFLKSAAGILLTAPAIRELIPEMTIINMQSHNNQIQFGILWQLDAKYNELISGKGMLEIRNAISAEKTESFLAPRLREELGRKPVIAMAWGSAHYGIKSILENPQERHRILRENKIGEYVKKSYPRSLRIHLDQNGEVIKIEEFKGTLKIPKAKPKTKPKLTRRAFLRRHFGSRRKV